MTRSRAWCHHRQVNIVKARVEHDALRGPDEPYAKGGLNMAKRENTNKHEIHLFHLRENMSRLRENICRIT